jgi:hypothetical protein
VIRQAISCDVCGAEKRQTNNWFVAYNHAGELRISSWNSSARQRPGTKHLCGQTCLHKLVDEFMARTLAARAPSAAQDEAEPEGALPSARLERIEMKSAAGYAATASGRKETATDTSLTSSAAYDDEFESSARLIPTPMPPLPVRPPVELAAVATVRGKEIALLPAEPPRFASRNRRSEAWERERKREDGDTGHRREIGLRRISYSK